MTTPQAPIPSGYGFETTAEEIIGDMDLTGKVAIVTGGYSGIGLETVRVLSKAGATVVVPARREETAREALAGIANVEVAEMELSDPASIDAFATNFLSSGRPLHLLIMSAGIMTPPLTRDARGYELQFSVNHLGHYQLTARLWPGLVAAKGARVVVLSSAAHIFSAVDLDDPNYERREYVKFTAYGQSKTANALFALKADAVGAPHGIRVFSVHPGAIATNLVRFMTAEELEAASATPAGVAPLRYKTVGQGAATMVWCAVSPQLDGKGGVYCEDVDIAPSTPEDATVISGARPWACDPVAADRLWTLSEQMTGVAFPA